MTEGRREHSPAPATGEGFESTAKAPRKKAQSEQIPAEGAAPPERSGPLAVERHRKADGRLLILYSRADGER
jgi:hypothetical protein